VEEEFSVFMNEGTSGLADFLKEKGTKANPKLAARNIKNSFDKKLLFPFLVANEVGPPIGFGEDTINSPILVKQGGEIELQPYLINIVEPSKRSKSIIDRISAKYRGFKSLKMRQEMIADVLDNFDLQLTATGEQRLTSDVNLEDRKLLDSALGLFVDKRKDAPVTSSVLTAPLDDKDVVLVVAEHPEEKRRTALKRLEEQPKDIRDILSMYINKLRGSLGEKVSIDRLDADIDIFSELIGKGDLRLTKNRRKIYDYWEKIEGKYAAFSDAHKAFARGLDGSELKDTEDKELSQYIEDFLKLKDADLRYVYEYPAVDSSSLETKGPQLMDVFLEEIGMAPKDKTQAPSKNIGPSAAPKRDDKTGTFSFQAEMDEEETVVDPIPRLVEVFNDIIPVKVDPLYAYAYDNGKAGFKISPAAEKEMRKVINRQRKTAIRFGLSENTLRRLQSYADDIEMRSYIQERDFFLPYQEGLALDLPEGAKDNSTNIRKYLKTISQFISAGEDLEQPTGKGRGQLGGTAPFEGTFRSSLPALQGEMVGDKSLGDLYETLLSAITEYFIEPSTSTNRPLSRKFEWMETKTLRVLSKDRMRGNAFVTILGLKKTSGTILRKSVLTDIIALLKKIAKPTNRENVDDFMRDIENVGSRVDKVFKRNDSEAVSIEFGNLAYRVLDRNGLNTNRRFGIGTAKKPLEEWADMYDTSRIYPFAALYQHLVMSQGNYTEADMGDEVREIINLEKKMDIVKSETESNLLHAHDAIRKMMKKPVYYGLSKVDDYDDMQSTIDIMKSKFNTDVTALEIESIVSELDSMTSLSKKYGISTEGVYFLKAIHR
tara:strand:+ start:1568 stop:4051 length:2484 start_codon:yes stop_codon:yes gene_type:complete